MQVIVVFTCHILKNYCKMTNVLLVGWVKLIESKIKYFITQLIYLYYCLARFSKWMWCLFIRQVSQSLHLLLPYSRLVGVAKIISRTWATPRDESHHTRKDGIRKRKHVPSFLPISCPFLTLVSF